MQTWFATQINFPFIYDFYFGENESHVQSSFMVHLDYFMTITLFLLTALMPVFIVVFYRGHKLRHAHFENKYGAVYEGLNKKQSALLFNAFFILRRLAFSLAVFHLGHFSWLQLTTQITITLFSAAYLLHV